MNFLQSDDLYENVCHKVENLPIKIYKTRGVYLHWHTEYEFILVNKGSVLCIVNGEQITLSENNAILLRSGDLHAIHNDTDAEVTAIVVSPRFWANQSFSPLFKKEIQYQSFFNKDNDIDRSIINTLWEIVDVYNEKPFGYDFILMTRFSEIFACLLTNGRFTNSKKPSKPIPSEFNTLIDYIHSHYQEKIALDTLSNISFYSKTYIMKLFKRYTFLTPMEYIIEYKLEIAKEMLKNSTASNLRVAVSCGFNSETYFIRAFKKRYGITPSAYRKQSRD